YTFRLGRDIVNVYLSQEDYENAYNLQQQELATSRELGLDHLLANGLLTLGKIARLRQSPDEATASFEESLSIYRLLGDQAGVEVCLAALKAAPDSMTFDFQ